jgi:iron complex transport system permease protein
VKRWSLQQFLLTMLMAAAIWAVLAGLCLTVGSTGFSIPTRELWLDRSDHVFLASLVGAALAAAGLTYQAVLRNPLADPYLLGVSSGASLAVFLWALPFAAAAPLVGSLSQQAFAFAGALVSVAAVLVLAQRRGRIEPVTLLLVGVIINAINGSVFLLLYHLNLRRDVTETTGGPFRFLVGGIQTLVTTEQVAVAGITIAVGWIILLLLSGQLNVAVLSESEAQSLGVRVHRLRWTAMVVASVVTAAAVSISGPIGFVGLVCPHLSRLMVGSDQRRLLPVATALGAGLLAVADASARLLGSQQFAATILPVGILTGLLGGPFFLLLLWQARKRDTLTRPTEVGR